MENKFTTRLMHAWDAFMSRDPTPISNVEFTQSYYRKPDRVKLTRTNEQTMMNSILNRIAVDAATVKIFHVELDDQDRYLKTKKTGLNECLTVSANLDQTGRSFRQDIFMTLLDKGYVAITPTRTSDNNPTLAESFNITSLRVGEITQWYPEHVKIKLYNEHTGEKVERLYPKRAVAIVENPFYSVMNEPNSTLKRLTQKLRVLDMIDEHTASGKLDMIIQLPYTVKTDLRREQAERRRKDLEDQISGRLGIAYTDATEKIIQLNRPLENNLLKQIETLTNTLYGELGLTAEILNGSADEKAMLNYNSRTIEPLVSAVVDAMIKAFLTKTARSQRQSIMAFRDPFTLVPVSDLAELADKMTRNEIMSSNEVRQVLGLKPSSDPKADQLLNSNIKQSKQAEAEIEGYDLPEEVYEDEET